MTTCEASRRPGTHAGSARKQVKRVTARARVDSAPLDGAAIRKLVRSLFRRRNDYSTVSIDELPAELHRFGITTFKHLRRLMKKHRRSLVEAENVRMSRSEVLWLCSESDFDGAGIDVFSATSWYAIPGLVRQAMELEFGEGAAVYVGGR